MVESVKILKTNREGVSVSWLGGHVGPRRN